MAAAEHPLARALTRLSACLRRAPVSPSTPAGCAELLQALVHWAAPGAADGGVKEVPDRAAAALRASLLLLEAVSAESRGGHVSGAGPAQAELVLEAESAEEAGKHVGSSLPSETAVAPKGGFNPKEECDVFTLKEAGAALSLEVDHVDPESTENSGGAPTEENFESPNNSEGATNSDLGTVSGPFPDSILDPRCILRCATAPLLLLCGAHIKDAPWSDVESRRLANQLLRSLLEESRCTTVAELLNWPQEQPYGTFKETLGLLGPQLRKDTWESHPDAKLLFSWLLFQVPRPWLAEFLGLVMPPSLLFSDDYKMENKVLGVRCLHHIIRNVPAAELRQYNRALVAYHALRNHLYTKDPEVIEVVLPCLVDLFPVLHKPPPAVGAYQKDGESPSDQVMQMVLTDMEMEHKIVLRRLYARNLPALQERLGIRIARHMKRLLRVIVGYLEVSDGPEETARLSILDTLQGTIKYAWPRIPPRLPLLLKTLVKLIYELSSESNQNSAPVTEALLNGATECLLLLDRCSKGLVKSALQGLPSVCAEPLLLKCIHRLPESDRNGT